MVNWNTDYYKIIKAIEWRFYQSLSIYILMINLMSKSKNNIFGSAHLNGIKIQSPLLMVILLYGTFWSWGNFVISTDSTSTMLYPPSRTQPSAITRFSYFWNTILSKWLRSIFSNKWEELYINLHEVFPYTTEKQANLNITANISVCVYVILAKNKVNWIHVSQTLSMKIISFFPSSRQFMLSSMSRWRWDLVPPLLNHKTTVSCRFWKPPHWRLSGRFRSSTTVKSWLLKSTQKYP